MEIEKLIEEINNNEEYKSFLKLKEEMVKKGYNLDKKFAIFKDEKGNINIVEIYINMGQCIGIKSKNEEGEETRIYEYIFSS